MTDQNTSPTPQSSGLDPNLASLLCYVCGVVTAIIFLLLEKDNKRVRLHAWHSLVFWGVMFILGMALSVVGQIVLHISFWLYSAFSLLTLLVWLGVMALWIVLMVKAYQGSILELPVITDIARKQAEK